MTIRYSNYKRYGSTVKVGAATEIKNPTSPIGAGHRNICSNLGLSPVV